MFPQHPSFIHCEGCREPSIVPYGEEEMGPLTDHDHVTLKSFALFLWTVALQVKAESINFKLSDCAVTTFL